MKKVKTSELPPLVYQLLVLSGKGHRSVVLEGIKMLFYQLDKEILEPSDEELMDRCVCMCTCVRMFVCEGNCVCVCVCVRVKDL